MNERKGLDWSWMESFMPGVVSMIKERRAAGLGKHVNECWKRGVIKGEPNWFFAREGSVCIGTPFTDGDLNATLAAYGAWDQNRREPLLMLASSDSTTKDEEAGHGAN